MPKMGLVLTGGGARAAYQAGVLRAIAEIKQFKTYPFSIVSGFSAGAINAIWLAAHCEDFDKVTRNMWDAWENIRVQDVFRTDPISVIRLWSEWAKGLALGGCLGKTTSTHLLDTSALASFLEKRINFSAIHQHVKSGKLHGISLSAMNYRTGTSTAFFDGSDKIKPWVRERRIGVRSEITLNHLLASVAIPIFFPPVRLGDSFYGDGMIGMNSPLSPAIHMGSNRIFSIGLHRFKPTAVVEKENAGLPSISVATILDTLFNCLFFSAIDADRERLVRINRTNSFLSSAQRAKDPDGLRVVPITSVHPSKDLGEIASVEFSNFLTRYLMKGLGVSNDAGLDFLSYFCFDSRYTKTLLELGYKDGIAEEKWIRKFFDE